MMERRLTFTYKLQKYPWKNKKLELDLSQSQNNSKYVLNKRLKSVGL